MPPSVLRGQIKSYSTWVDDARQDLIQGNRKNRDLPTFARNDKVAAVRQQDYRVETGNNPSRPPRYAVE